MKRHEELKGMSRDHHHALLLCWKLRKGLQEKIGPDRIKAYTTWFWATHLKDHFRVEEEFVFTILDPSDSLRIQALAEHQKLERLFTGSELDVSYFSEIEQTLEQHIRFEERLLFQKIQDCATKEQLEHIGKAHLETATDIWEDPFWL